MGVKELNGSDINYCLGYHPDKVYLLVTEKVEKILSLNRYQNCFIYSSIIQNQLVGDNQGTDSNTCFATMAKRIFYQ